MSFGAILVLVALTAILLGFRWLVRKGVNSVFDAFDNKRARKKNEENKGTSESLADRYK